VIYESKKNVGMKVKVVDKVSNGANTAYMLEYLPGYDDSKTGHQFSISESTLKRWWKLVDVTEEPEEKSVAEILHLDMDKINEPYPEPKEQKYIPKPQSVIEYEEKKTRARRKELDFELPKSYEEFADYLANNNIKIARVNTGYISFADSSKLKLLTSGIGVLASNDLGTLLAEKGLVSRPCIEKGTPFRFDAQHKDEYDALVYALQSLYKID